MYDSDEVVRGLNNTWSVFNRRVYLELLQIRRDYLKEIKKNRLNDSNFNSSLKRGKRRTIYNSFDKKMQDLGLYLYNYIKGTDLVIFINKGDLIRLDIESLILMRSWCKEVTVEVGVDESSSGVYSDIILEVIDYVTMVVIFYRIDLILKTLETVQLKNGYFKPYLELYQQLLKGGIVYAGDLMPIQRLKIYPYLISPDIGSFVIWRRKNLLSYIFEHILTGESLGTIMDVFKSGVYGTFVTFIEKEVESDLVEYLLNGQSIQLLKELFGEFLYRRGQGNWGSLDGNSLIWNTSDFYTKDIKSVLYMFQELYIKTVEDVVLGANVLGLKPKLVSVSDRSIVYYYENTLVLNDNKSIITSISNDIEIINADTVIGNLCDNLLNDLDTALLFLI